MFPSLIAVAVLLFSAAASADYLKNNGGPLVIQQQWDGGSCNSISDCKAQSEAVCAASIYAPCGPTTDQIPGQQWTQTRTGGGVAVFGVVWTPGDCPAGTVEGVDADGNACNPPAPSCDDSITGTAFLRPVFSGGHTGDICHEGSNCKMTAGDTTGLASGDLIEYTGTSQDCGSEPVEPISQGEEDPQCISDGANTWCTEPDLADENCGMLNGDYICLESVPDGGCTFYGNGDMACASNATSPPAPDNGTPGVPATPDGTLSTSDGTTTTNINTYNNTTVTGSSAGASGSNQGSDPGETPEIDLDFSQIIENEPSSDSFRGDVDTATTDLDNLGQTVLDELGDPSDFGETTSLNTTVNDAFQYSSCVDITLDAFGNPVTLSCSDVSDTRDVLGWIARVLFLLALFQLLTRGPD
jgi:hypothetical protein